MAFYGDAKLGQLNVTAKTVNEHSCSTLDQTRSRSVKKFKHKRKPKRATLRTDQTNESPVNYSKRYSWSEESSLRQLLIDCYDMDVHHQNVVVRCNSRKDTGGQMRAVKGKQRNPLTSITFPIADSDEQPSEVTSFVKVDRSLPLFLGELH